MIEKTFVLTVRDCPKSINAGGGGTRRHWSQAHAEKKKWQGIFLLELMAAKVQKKMQFCTVHVMVRFKHKSGKGRDTENYRQPVIKPFFDAMTEGGYLPDDTEEYVKVAGFELHDGVAVWPYPDAMRLKSEIIIKLEGSYL